jgi:PKD repeat protein
LLKTAPFAALVAVVMALALAAPALGVPPTGTISVTPAAPDRPNIGDQVTFDVTGINWGGTAGTVLWAFGDGQAATTLPATHAYASAGIKSVAAVLTNGEGENGLVGPVDVRVNAPPVVVLSGFIPVAPIPGVDVLFASDSTDPDGDAITHLWNFGDGVTSPNRNAVHAFASAGTRTVTLTVTDPFGAVASATQDVPVVALTPPDGPPRARFVYTPRTPVVGDQVVLASTSVDPEDQLREQRWDLDGDGEFDDARGDEVIHTFSESGAKRVRLRVEDAGGKAAEAERTIRVEKAPRVPPGYLRPPPDVAFTAAILPNGVRVQTLGIRAPAKALIRVRCRGRTCGVKQRRKRSKGRAVRFKTYERFLHAGVRVEIFVSKPGLIGFYRRYTIRAGKGTKRKTTCLSARRAKPIRCPR